MGLLRKGENMKKSVLKVMGVLCLATASATYAAPNDMGGGSGRSLADRKAEIVSELESIQAQVERGTVFQMYDVDSNELSYGDRLLLRRIELQQELRVVELEETFGAANAKRILQLEAKIASLKKTLKESSSWSRNVHDGEGKTALEYITEDLEAAQTELAQILNSEKK